MIASFIDAHGVAVCSVAAVMFFAAAIRRARMGCL